MRRLVGLMLAAVAVGVLFESSARAEDFYDDLEWACNQKPENLQAARAALANSCQFNQWCASGNGCMAIPACSPLTGTPWACWSNSIQHFPTNNCGNRSQTLYIEGEIQGFAWTVHGQINVMAYRYTTFDQNLCVVSNGAMTTAGGGTYVSESGYATLQLQMNASGTGSITFAGGTIFEFTLGIDYNKSCSLSVGVNGSHSENLGGCGTATNNCNGYQLCGEGKPPCPSGQNCIACPVCGPHCYGGGMTSGSQFINVGGSCANGGTCMPPSTCINGICTVPSGGGTGGTGGGGTGGTGGGTGGPDGGGGG